MSTNHNEPTRLTYDQLLVGRPVGDGHHPLEAIGLDEFDGDVSELLAIKALGTQKRFTPTGNVPSGELLKQLSTMLDWKAIGSMKSPDVLARLEAIGGLLNQADVDFTKSSESLAALVAQYMEELLEARKETARQMGRVAEGRMLYVCGLDSDRKVNAPVFLGRMKGVASMSENGRVDYEPVVQTQFGTGLLPKGMKIFNGIYVPAEVDR